MNAKKYRLQNKTSSKIQEDSEYYGIIKIGEKQNNNKGDFKYLQNTQEIQSHTLHYCRCIHKNHGIVCY